MGKWTPGPWHTKAEYDHMTVHRETGGMVADCAITVPGPVTDAELRANARLIAAAPVTHDAASALLDRLSEWEADHLNDENFRDWNGHVEPAIAQLRAALAAAEGRS